MPLSMLEGFQLPITRRGRFLEDDFFRGYQKNYTRAVDDVLDRWGSRKSLADRLASYRRLREKDASEDTKAATISQTDDAYMIVLDMSDFASGEITVQTSGFSAVVDGKAPPRTFNRRFPLPQNTIIDRVVADLSDDNILTITAPKKGGKGVPINMEPGEGATASVQQQQQQSSSVSSLEEQIIPTKTSPVAQAPSGSRVIPLEMEGESTSVTTSTTASSSTGESVVQAVKSEELSARRGSNTRIIPLNIEGEDGGSSSSSTSAFSTISSTSHNRMLPIKRRGKFLQDATFEKVWKDFETALDELVARKGSRAGLEDDRLQSYRNLRQCVQQDDNQAADVSKDEGEIKIVVDVKDYADGHLDVKAQDGAIVVKGKKGPCSFERRFSLPNLTQPETVTAALSDDGVLTITAQV